jgi:hypothetical protein
MKQHDDNTDWVISTDKTEDLRVFTFSLDIKEDDFDNWQEVVHLYQARCNKTIRNTSVLRPKKPNCADSVIACTPISVRAIRPSLLKSPKSAINISHESYVSQALLLSKAGGDQNVPQAKAGGDQNIPHHQKASLEVAK